MEFYAKFCLSSQITTQKTGCLIVPIISLASLANDKTPYVNQLNKASNNYFTEILKSGDLNLEKAGNTLLLHKVPGIAAKRVLLVSTPIEKDKSGIKTFDFIKAIRAAATFLRGINNPTDNDFMSLLHTVPSDTGNNEQWAIRHVSQLFADAFYTFDQFKSKPAKKFVVRLTFAIERKSDLSSTERTLSHARAIAYGNYLTRDLSNYPANICTPTYLAEQAKKLAKSYKSISVAVLNTKEMQALKMGGILAIAEGSAQPPKLITIKYQGTTDKNGPYVLVGKGVTFDTGGNSLKPAASMIGMKYDMCGAATVMGVIAACAQMKLPLNIIGVIPSVENMPGGTAARPNDIVTTMSGQTVEILNTDAEGRMILCDALTYCERFKPKLVIDIATLTGACVVALGRHAAGLFSEDKELTNDLVAAGEYCYDRAWPLPLWEDYQSQLDSTAADFSNMGGPEAGSISAACFLARFTKKYRWAHLDIAGSAFNFLNPKAGATGRPVPMLVQYFLNKI